VLEHLVDDDFAEVVLVLVHVVELVLSAEVSAATAGCVGYAFAVLEIFFSLVHVLLMEVVSSAALRFSTVMVRVEGHAGTVVVLFISAAAFWCFA
jgi:hypothetical protein